MSTRGLCQTPPSPDLAVRGVVLVAPSVCHGVGGGEGGEGKGEKAAAAAQGESGRRLREGGVIPY
jgi:hypothetical protein